MTFVETVIRQPENANVRSVMRALLVGLLLGCSIIASAQATSQGNEPATAQSRSMLFTPGSVEIKSLPKNLFVDQVDFWTAPAHMGQKQWEWAAPAIIAGAGLIAADNNIEKHVPRSSTTVSHAVTASNAGVAALAGAGAGLFALGHLKGDDHERETGILAGEAAIGAFLDTEAFKYAAGRERPFTGSGTGRFFVGGDSFPSVHASVGWAIASVIAHEYPGFLSQVLSYGVAGGVSAARWGGQKHFASDLVIGSALGWYMGWQVYHSHYSDADLARYGTFSKGEKEESGARNIGSAYVPLDSWIYPALERLVALGYIDTAALGLRPWTRLECMRLLDEASDHQADMVSPLEVQQLYDALAHEFAVESDEISGKSTRNAHLESVYERTLGISGTPLTDNYHFGQTLLNDYGRPYEEGVNAVAGASGWGTAGPFVFYARGEYQYAPSAAAPSATELDFFHSTDAWPAFPPLPVAQTSRFQLLDSYVGMNFANWQLSFGKHSLWWGPSDGGAMIYTNNAPPLNKTFMLDRVTPFQLPWLLRYLGDIRLQFFIGQLSGQEFKNTIFSGSSTSTTIGQYGKDLNPQPFLSGGKISLKLAKNFEFGMAKTTLYGGPGNPLTPKTFLQSTAGVHVNGDVLGDGRTSADFSYRIPYLRDWITLYGEALSEDEISPMPYMRKSVSEGGLYFAKIPRIPKLDLRLEGGYTSPTLFYDGCTSCFYSNFQYVSGYTNQGQLIGTWVGRAAQGELIRTNYWLGPRKKIGLELRHRKIDRQYVPQGGTQNDLSVNADIFTARDFRFSGNLQYERWQIPLLANSRQSNVAASFQFSFWPTARVH